MGRGVSGVGEWECEHVGRGVGEGRGLPDVCLFWHDLGDIPKSFNDVCNGF